MEPTTPNASSTGPVDADPSAAHLLVIDDDPLVGEALRMGLEADGHAVVLAADAKAARAATNSRPPDLVVLDAVLPDALPEQLLREFTATIAETPVVLVTAYPTIAGAIGAYRDGAFAYLPKPFELTTLRALIDEALATTRMARGLADARRSVANGRCHSTIVTDCPDVRRVLDLAAQAAAHPSVTVLIEGESGTGKGLLARCIHDWSVRRGAPFVAVNCAAVPESLLESEFFGHARGAFTGANVARSGLAAAAHGGTLFLDEIGEISAHLQAKLLQLIETHRYRPVGATDEQESDVRIVAATNRNLTDAVRAGRFREDLYFRLRVLPIRMPALRERVADLPLLAQQFLVAIGAQLGRRGVTLDPPALACLQRYGWPGNVRELRNVIERALVVGTGPRIGLADLPAELRDPTAETRGPWRFVLPAAGTDVRAAERDFVIQALERTGGNRTEAGRLLGLSRDGVRYRVKKLGLDAPDGESPPSA